MIKLAPSILASDFSILRQELECIESAGAHYAHIDVMDGCFVPNITIGAPVVKSLKAHSKIVFDVHLMVEEPGRFVEDFYNAGADIINVHVEACKHLHRTVQKIKSLGVKVGVTLNPATPLNVLEYVLEDLDMVLIMSVNPGFGGQTFIPSSLKKIELLAKTIQQKNLNIEIEVDGGVTIDNVRTVIDAGANVIVAGGAVYQKDHTSENVKKFLEIFNSYK